MFDVKAYRAKLKTEGKCITCTKPSPSGHSRCEACRGRNHEARKRITEKVKEWGGCLWCRKAKAMEGHSFCEECLPKQNAATRGHSRKRKEAGQCRVCAKPVEGRTLCEECGGKNNEGVKANRRRKKAAGVCCTCGRRANLRQPEVEMGRRLSWYCETCYMKTLARNVLGSSDFLPVLLDKLDRCGWRCVYTGERLVAGVNLSFDHCDPVSRFPERRSDPNNVEPVTFRVNLMKRDLTKAEFLALVDSIMRHTQESDGS